MWHVSLHAAPISSACGQCMGNMIRPAEIPLRWNAVKRNRLKWRAPRVCFLHVVFFSWRRTLHLYCVYMHFSSQLVHVHVCRLSRGSMPATFVYVLIERQGRMEEKEMENHRALRERKRKTRPKKNMKRAKREIRITNRC